MNNTEKRDLKISYWIMTLTFGVLIVVSGLFPGVVGAVYSEKLGLHWVEAFFLLTAIFVVGLALMYSLGRFTVRRWNND